MTLVTRRAILGTAAGFIAASSLTFAGRAAKAETADMTIDEVLFDPDNPVLGNPDGDVTIVEYFDYQCPYCKANHPVLTDVVESDGNIRLVMKDWPIFGAPSVTASQLALGAAKGGGYEKASDALMATEGRLSDEIVRQTLSDAGFDPSALEAAYKADRAIWDGLLGRNSKQASLMGLQGTPAFIIGTTIYPGAMDKAALLEAVALARA